MYSKEIPYFKIIKFIHTFRKLVTNQNPFLHILKKRKMLEECAFTEKEKNEKNKLI